VRPAGPASVFGFKAPRPGRRPVGLCFRRALEGAQVFQRLLRLGIQRVELQHLVQLDFRLGEPALPGVRDAEVQPAQQVVRPQAHHLGKLRLRLLELLVHGQLHAQQIARLPGAGLHPHGFA
jgi:hypothetical protein